MEQVNTGVTLKSIRIQQLQDKIAQLESENASGNANMLFDTVILKLNLKNDAALARRLTTGAPSISNIRAGRLPVGSGLLIRLHEESELSIRELKALAGI